MHDHDHHSILLQELEQACRGVADAEEYAKVVNRLIVVVAASRPGHHGRTDAQVSSLLQLLATALPQIDRSVMAAAL